MPPHRDQFVHWLLDTDATHALLLEGDVVPPPDVLDRLLEADVPAVTAAYPQWVDDRLAANVQAVADQTWSDTIPAKLFPIRRCLLGCVLVRREVFTTVPSPWFLATMAATRFVDDDEWFCGAVRQAGLRLLCDGASGLRPRTESVRRDARNRRRPAADRRRIGDDRQRHVRLGERRGARHPRRVPVEPRRPDDRLLC